VTDLGSELVFVRNQGVNPLMGTFLKVSAETFCRNFFFEKKNPKKSKCREMVATKMGENRNAPDEKSPFWGEKLKCRNFFCRNFFLV